VDTTAAVLERHLQALAVGDVDALMADYADDAVVISGPNPIRGREAITQMFKAISANPPQIVEEVHVVDGEVGYITWHSDHMPFGTDTFVVRDGKIVYQTVAFKS
jgi:uncharacterized protein (TIGR02246 family)